MLESRCSRPCEWLSRSDAVTIAAVGIIHRHHHQRQQQQIAIVEIAVGVTLAYMVVADFVERLAGKIGSYALAPRTAAYPHSPQRLVFGVYSWCSAVWGHSYHQTL